MAATVTSSKRSRTMSADSQTNLSKKQNMQSSPQPDKMSAEEAEESTNEMSTAEVTEETKLVEEEVTIKAVMDSLKLLHIKFDSQAHRIETLHNDIHGSGGIEDRLVIIEDSADTNTESICSLQEDN